MRQSPVADTMLRLDDSYVPVPRWRGGHRMTVYAWARLRRFPRLPAPETRHFDVAVNARVLAHCHWQPDRRDRPTLVALHGLEGSSTAHYMKGMAEKAFRRGFNVVRLNQRNCGGTESLSAGLYHSGLTGDPLAVLRELIDRDRLHAIAVAGYSLGGNLALKLAGELGDQAPPELRAVAAVSPTVDLDSAVDAIERRSNWIYQWHFMISLRRRIKRKARLFPDLYRVDGIRRIRTIRQFDDAFTAPHHGFRDAADYYYRASALRVIHRVAVPTLIISAADDPFVPVEPLLDTRVRGNRHITLAITRFGGHCGFIGPREDGDDGYWAERRLVEFAAAHMPPAVQQEDDLAPAVGSE